MPAGQKTKYEPARVAKIIEAIGVGATYQIAAGHAGISVDTLDRWRKRYADFADMLFEAEGKAAVKWLSKIELDPSWQSSAWKLERRYPNEYGKTISEQRVTGPDGGPLVINLNREPKAGKGE